ncbi:MAG: PhoU domain-containing protein [Pseudomonadota bacterium]
MVLKELIAFWHDDSPLKEIFKRFDEMIVIAKDMFKIATSYFSSKVEGETIYHQLIQMDSKLNTLQQVLRRDIVTHISVQGTADIVPCLLLISLVKDVERIGDYCKNIDEIFRHAPYTVKDPLAPELKDMSLKIVTWFEQTKRAFDNCDKELARKTREDAYFSEKECDKLVWALSEDNKGRNAVAAALMIRFFKRVIAHLGNICTSVVMPFDKLDYFEKPKGKPGELIEDE